MLYFIESKNLKKFEYSEIRSDKLPFSSKVNDSLQFSSSKFIKSENKIFALTNVTYIDNKSYKFNEYNEVWIGNLEEEEKKNQNPKNNNSKSDSEKLIDQKINKKDTNSNQKDKKSNNTCNNNKSDDKKSQECKKTDQLYL